ncbi:hypothetical protein A3SI_17704 [Nitritalea halalkaliphila LW7]|uniref:Uncharacterized protein n=1 Tax=Nitritalea halalkaliphila LW7 TaxID=1189621 RepID=I5BVM2_9BACT|nr:hypothetical protein [Nitritalea halalkaliphila]EIM73624.1 hypothetical protein A3SI_17704 [Nitritalea halalkaliphila LW7]
MNSDFSIEHTQEEERKRAVWWTVGINVALLLLLYFVVVWRSPDPPLSRYGMELQLGFSDVGSGNQPSPSPSRQQTTTPEAAAPGEVAPQVVEAPQPWQVLSLKKLELILRRYSRAYRPCSPSLAL